MSEHVPNRMPERMWGVVKTPRPFKWFFQTLWCFFLLSFFQALASHLDQRIHMSEHREKEKE
jgi:hypothetical protein